MGVFTVGVSQPRSNTVVRFAFAGVSRSVQPRTNVYKHTTILYGPEIRNPVTAPLYCARIGK